MQTLILLVLPTLLAAVLAAPRQTCGQIKCNEDEYCSTETNQCVKCKTVCDKDHHNYEPKICEANCEMPMEVSLESVQLQARLALIFSCVALSLLLCILLILLRKTSCNKSSWKNFFRKFLPAKKRVNQNPVDLTHSNPNTVSPRSRPGLSLGINSNRNTATSNLETLNVKSLTGEANPRTVCPNKNKKYPAEDASLDNNCYDNMAMNVTPSPTSTVTVVGRSF